MFNVKSSSIMLSQFVWFNNLFVIDEIRQNNPFEKNYTYVECLNNKHLI